VNFITDIPDPDKTAGPVVTEPLMNATQLADFLGVSKATVYRWAEDGRLPSLRLGPGVVRFDPTAVRGWLETRVRESEALLDSGTTQPPQIAPRDTGK
jgi:excisionase family DNA binding protein